MCPLKSTIVILRIKIQKNEDARNIFSAIANLMNKSENYF